MLYSHTKVLRRQLEEAVLLDWAQGRGVFRLGKREFVVKITVLNLKFEQ